MVYLNEKTERRFYYREEDGKTAGRAGSRVRFLFDLSVGRE